MKNLLTLIITLFSVYSYSQDTLQVMQYNLLNYGNYTNYCPSSVNNVNTKNIHLRTIIHYVKPDIFTVNELSKATSYHQMILDQVMNENGGNKYRKAVSFNYADSYLVNMLYYNQQKLTLYRQDVAHAAVRDIDVYTLYYNSADLAQTHDTIFITCFVAHLKAGNTESSASKRAGMVSTAMTYIRTHDLPDNMLFMGDFNVYTDNEQAYKNLIYTYSGIQYFYDPINREGSWNNNSSFKDVHTQSTHASKKGCFASGGLDDRFDFIMSSGSLLQGSDGMKLLTNTYHALGNDGQHFNKNINDSPTNTAAPESIINALYHMSDHLPILTKIKVDANVGIDEMVSDISSIRFQNPSKADFQISIQLKKPQSVKLEIYDVFGRLMIFKNLNSSNESLTFSLSLNSLADGAYVLKLTDENNLISSRKFILKK
jgi:endonuclease/exonuclease/phosphatase family metal-dependent hydrolase